MRTTFAPALDAAWETRLSGPAPKPHGTYRMKRMLSVLAVLAAGLAATAAPPRRRRGSRSRARPSRAEAEARAAEWDRRLDDVSGFSTGGNWYAIALGPYTEDEARARLLRLRGQGLVPPDSFVANGRAFGAQVYAGARGPAVPGAENRRSGGRTGTARQKR